jgi:hypothetical protein
MLGYGNQIRSYVLAPYTLVKDLRTDVETADARGVLDGALDAFMRAALAQRFGNSPAWANLTPSRQRDAWNALQRRAVTEFNVAQPD